MSNKPRTHSQRHPSESRRTAAISSLDPTSSATRGALLARAAGGRGFGLIELLAVVALSTILFATALPHLDSRRWDIDSALRRVAADVRWTRARALGSGTHFALRVIGTNSYQIERLQLVADNWQVAAVVRRTTLPQTVAIVDFTPQVVEFDTRGAVAFPSGTTPAPWTPHLVDETFSSDRAFAIWPSGQFHVLP